MSLSLAIKTLKIYIIIAVPGSYLLGLQSLFYAASGQDMRHNLVLMFISFSTAIYLCHRWPLKQARTRFIGKNLKLREVTWSIH